MAARQTGLSGEGRGGERRRQIIDAAERCFVRRGFHAATMPEICAEADLSPGTLYRYFRSKEELIEALIERDRDENLAAIAAMAAAPDAATAIRQVVAETAEALKEPGMAALFVETMAEAARNPRVGVMIRAHEASVGGATVALLEEGQLSGEIDPALDAAVAARLLGALFDGLVVRAAVDPELDLEALGPALVDAVISLLHNPAARPTTA